MKSRKSASLSCFLVACLACLTELSSCGGIVPPSSSVGSATSQSSEQSAKKVAAIVLKPAPTVTSIYGQDLAIADDGILKIKYEDDSRDSVPVTLDMVNQEGFNKNSIESQTLYVVYAGLKASFSFALTRKLQSISIKTPPTITSKATYPFAIGDDGVLTVKYADGGTAEVKITIDMIDVASIDVNSTETQAINITYQNKTIPWKIVLKQEEEDNTGEKKTTRFEAEWSQYEGSSYVGVEDCTGQTRADGSQEQCLKGLFQVSAGGHMKYTISCDKITTSDLVFDISKISGFSGNFDHFVKFYVNNVQIASGIKVVGDNSGWWDWLACPVTSPIHLRKGENTIELYTNEMANKDAWTGGGLNINWLEISTTGTLTWTPEKTK